MNTISITYKSDSFTYETIIVKHEATPLEVTRALNENLLNQDKTITLVDVVLFLHRNKGCIITANRFFPYLELMEDSGFIPEKNVIEFSNNMEFTLYNY
jgi:hypothetical protein